MPRPHRRSHAGALATLMAALVSCTSEGGGAHRSPTSSEGRARAAPLHGQGAPEALRGDASGGATRRDAAVADAACCTDAATTLDGAAWARDAGTLARLAHLPLAGDASVLAMSSRGNLLVLGRAAAPGPTPELVVVRIGSPGEMTVVGSLDLDADVNAVAIEGTRVYAATSDDARELAIIDVTDPTTPVVVGGFDAAGPADGACLDAAGTRVVLGRRASAAPELDLLDATDPGAVLETAAAEIGADVNGVDTNATVAYLATSDPNGQLQAFYYGQPGPPIGPWRFNTGSPELGRAIDVSEQHVYLVTTGNGAGHLLELAAPWRTVPTYLDSVRFAREPTGVVRFGGRALVGFRDGGIGIVGGLDRQAFNALALPPTGPIPDAGVRSFTTDAGAPDAAFDADAGAPARASPPTPHVEPKSGRLALESVDVSLGDVRAFAVRDGEWIVAGPGGVDAVRSHLVPIVVDRNADGLRIVAALGDSNTKRADTLPTWPDDLPALLRTPGWRIANLGHPLSGLEPTAPVPNATRELDVAVARDAPDAVVAAFGSIDSALINALALYYHAQPNEDSVDGFASGLLGLRARAEGEGLLPFFALTPPRNEAVHGEFEQLICEMNHRLRNDFDPAFVIDFFSTMSAPGDYLDEVHLGPTGQEKRALEVARKLEP